MLSVGTRKKHEKTPPQQPARKAFVVVGTSWAFRDGCNNFNAMASPVKTAAFCPKWSELKRDEKR